MNQCKGRNCKLPVAKFPWLISMLCVFLVSCNYFESEQSRLLKAKNYYDDNKFNKSIFTAKSILQSDPKNCEARILLGKNQFAKFSLADAGDSFDKAVKQDCKEPQLFYFLVKTQLYMNNLEKAGALFNDQDFSYVLKYPESIMLHGDVNFLQKNYDRAEELYRQYFSLTHDEAANCLSQVKLLVTKDKFNEVVTKTRDCESQYSNNKKYDIDQSRYLRAISLVNTKQTQDAVVTLNTVLAQYANNKDPNIKIQSALLLMKIHLVEKDVENANKMADVLLKYVATPDIYYVKGLKAEKDNRYDLAEQQFLSALKLNPRHKSSLLEMANIKYKENNIEQAKYYAGKADSVSGKNIFTEQLDELLALKYLQAGDLDSIINKIPHNKTGESRKSQYILALAYAKKGERDKAWNVFQDVARDLSSTEQKELLEARLYVALGELNKAETLYGKYVNSGSVYALTGLTQIYMRERKYEQAERLLINSLQKAPVKYNATLLLADLYANTGQKQKIFDLLNKAISDEPKNDGYKLVLAKAYYRYAKYQDALDLCGDIIKSDIKNIECYVIKANSSIRLGDINQASEVFRNLLKQSPDNTYSYLMLALLADKQSKPDDAMKYIDRALEINPRYMDAIYAKIELFLKQNRTQDAFEFAKTAANSFKQEQVKYLLMGFVYGKLGDDKNAYLNYRSAQENGNQDIRIAMRMYEYSLSVNGESTAYDELERFVKSQNKVENAYFAANYFMGRKNYKLAEKYYELFVRDKPDNVVALNNLAWIKMHDGDNKTAMTYIKKALLLAPTSAAIMDTMGQILLQSGEYDKAGSYLLSASEKMGENPSVKYHLALYYFHRNEIKKTRELLGQIVGSEFDEQADAKKLLARINAH